MTTNKQPFKGKVCYYSNINGKEQHLEKEFDSQDAMNQFIQEQDGWMHVPQFSFPTLQTRWPTHRDNWLDDFFEKKLSAKALTTSTPSSLDDLRREKTRLEREEQEQAKRKSLLEKLLEEAKELKAFFSKRNDKENMQKADAEIQKYENELQRCS